MINPCVQAVTLASRWQLVCYNPSYSKQRLRVVSVVGGRVGVGEPLASGLALTAAEWRRLVDGDRAVFRRVYEAYVGLLRYVAGRLGLGGEEVDEIVQETFLRLYERAGEVQDASKLKAWLVAATRNQAIDRLRSRRRQATPAASGDLSDASAQLWVPHVDVTRELEIDLVRDLLGRIAGAPGGETFRLFYVEGLSAKEIAARNGEAISTVTTRLSRLRDKFGEELRQHVLALRDGRHT